MYERAGARVVRCACLSMLLGAIACGGDAGAGDDDADEACSAGVADTYEGFGKPFITTYCVPCHGQTGAARMGAPASYVFDSLSQIREHAADIRSDAVVTKVMPFGSSSLKPTDAERVKLGAWLDCGAPE